MTPDDYDPDELEVQGPYIPSKNAFELERTFITKLEEHLGRVPCDAEVVGFCHNVIVPSRNKQYIFWKGKLLYYTDIIP